MARREGEFLGHPVGLYVLFFTEMWERFSYYGMRALLIFYMTKALQYSDQFATGTYGAYTGLVYATPLIGGMLADRFLGYRKAIIIGGVLMAIGEFALAFPNTVVFYTALALLIVGNGFFKPNISTLVGKLYPSGDERRDGAFTIFYMGINIGAFLTPLVCGYIGETYGWHYGFLLAGVGMVLGLCIFVMWGKHLGEHGGPPKPEAFEQPYAFGLSRLSSLYLGIIICIPVIAILVYRPTWVQVSVPVIAAVFLIYIIYEMSRCTPFERGRILVILVLVFFSITFWACFEQAGSSMSLFTDRLIDRHLFGWEIPASMFQSVNPLFIIVLAIPFSALWTWLGGRRMNPSSPLKFALALFQMALGFVAMVIAARRATEDGTAHMGWLILAYLLHTTGELCLSPVGLSMVTKLAPVRLGALLMGAWFLSNAFANVIGGAIAGLTGGEAGYERVFTMIVYVAGGLGVVLLLLTPILKRLGREDEANEADPSPQRKRGVTVEPTAGDAVVEAPGE
ncbi:MAG: peptide MFS transporter [Phycisphaerae bacterium]